MQSYLTLSLWTLHLPSTGREEKKLQKHIAITRIEQLCPFPYDLIQEEILKYPGAEICWTQEEHKNSGPWSYVFPRFSTVLQDNGRDVSINMSNQRLVSNKPHTSIMIHKIICCIAGASARGPPSSSSPRHRKQTHVWARVQAAD